MRTPALGSSGPLGPHRATSPQRAKRPAEKTPVLEGYGLQPVRNWLKIAPALAAKGCFLFATATFSAAPSARTSIPAAPPVPPVPASRGASRGAWRGAWRGSSRQDVSPASLSTPKGGLISLFSHISLFFLRNIPRAALYRNEDAYRALAPTGPPLSPQKDPKISNFTNTLHPGRDRAAAFTPRT